MEDSTDLLFDFTLTLDEFEFHRWNELPFDLRIKILEYIPFPTLRNFMFLSKESFLLVTRMNTPMFYVNLSNRGLIKEFENFVELSLSWSLHGRYEEEKYSRMYTLRFVEDENGCCFVERAPEKKRRRRIPSRGVHYNRSARFTALATLFHFSTYLDIRAVFAELDSLDPKDGEVFTMQPETTKIAKDKFYIATRASTMISSFLPFLEDGCPLVVLPLGKEIFLGTSFFDSALVHSSRKIQIEAQNGVTDDQIVLFQAYDITMPAPNVTAKAINRLLLEWLEGKRKINFIHLKGLRNITKEDILQNIEVVPWQQFVTMIHNGDWWNGWAEKSAGLHNGTNFLIVLVNEGSCQLMDSYFDDD
ncbi:F-box domain protein [Ancylostoma caninum]|uniref:F-box domain protein n=1 Tax=Ancylostoma caninum TaxID=29170 RepID=A0A368HCS5_ANCCA|nr:F-box domain protein [Ancylostoma caninum]